MEVRESGGVPFVPGLLLFGTGDTDSTLEYPFCWNKAGSTTEEFMFPNPWLCTGEKMKFETGPFQPEQFRFMSQLSLQQNTFGSFPLSEPYYQGLTPELIILSLSLEDNSLYAYRGSIEAEIGQIVA